MDRKIEVGATYRLPDVTVHISSVGDRVRVVFDAGREIYGFDADWFAAHATLVKAAERPLAVGDMVLLPSWGTIRPAPRPIVFIGGNFGEAIVDLGCEGLSRPFALVDLRRAEPT